MAGTGSRHEVVVVGAGVVGLAVVLRLLRDGHEVLVVDRAEAGMGASFGNAGTLATYACLPLATPWIWRDLPRLVLAADSPLSLRLSGLPALMPWLVRFARQTRRSRMRASAQALSGLLGRAWEAFEPLIEEAEALDLIHGGGCLYLYRSEATFEGGREERQLREALGVRQEILERSEIERLEPALAPVYAKALLFEDARHVYGPIRLVQRLAEAVKKRGGRFVTGLVETIVPEASSVRLVGPAIDLEAGTVVLAAGAWSRPLSRQLGDRIPLDTERGYHLEFAVDVPPVSRPICIAEAGLYVTPMRERLRVAGLVELGGLKARPDPRRWDQLANGARRLLPNLGEPSSTWIGFRPSMPDSLPVIGRSPRAPNVVYAFGHGHLGLTLAGITGQLVSALIAGRPDMSLLAPLSAGRF